MRQFYEAYQGGESVAPLARQLPWTHNLIKTALCVGLNADAARRVNGGHEKWLHAVVVGVVLLAASLGLEG